MGADQKNKDLLPTWRDRLSILFNWPLNLLAFFEILAVLVLILAMITSRPTTANDLWKMWTIVPLLIVGLLWHSIAIYRRRFWAIQLAGLMGVAAFVATLTRNKEFYLDPGIENYNQFNDFIIHLGWLYFFMSLFLVAVKHLRLRKSSGSINSAE